MPYILNFGRNPTENCVGYYEYSITERKNKCGDFVLFCGDVVFSVISLEFDENCNVGNTHNKEWSSNDHDVHDASQEYV